MSIVCSETRQRCEDDAVGEVEIPDANWSKEFGRCAGHDEERKRNLQKTRLVAVTWLYIVYYYYPGNSHTDYRVSYITHDLLC